MSISAKSGLRELRRCLRLVPVLIVLIIGGCGNSTPSEIPGFGSHMAFYPSTEPGNITITFVKRFANPEVEPDEGFTVTIPRAYVYYVDGYQRKHLWPGLARPEDKLYSALPSVVTTSGPVKLLIASPSGQPFLQVRKSEDFPEGDNADKYGGRTRRDVTSLTLHRSFVASAIWFERFSSRKIEQMQSIGAKEMIEFGMTRIGVPNGDTFFIDRDRRIIITCPMKSTPLTFCDYAFAFGDRWRVHAVFIDFRFAGGREFLDNRIGAVRKALCPHIGCD